MVPIDMANVPSARTAQPKWVNPTYSSKDKPTAAFTESPPRSAAVVGEWRAHQRNAVQRSWPVAQYRAQHGRMALLQCAVRRCAALR